MRETYEFRINEEFASLLFTENEGIRVTTSVRKVEVTSSDPRLLQIGELQGQLKSQTGKFFFAGWQIKRAYSPAELESASLFLMSSVPFDHCGEECDTKYDESTACAICGAGATQVSELRLDYRKIPKQRDVAVTIANEWIVSQRVANLLTANEISGAVLKPIHNAAKSNHKQMNEVRYQLIINSPKLHVTSSTRFGINPFDLDIAGMYRCPKGHLLGLNRLSELKVSKFNRDANELNLTQEYVGVRRGLLRPTPFLLVAPRVRSLFVDHKIKGAHFEIAMFDQTAL